MVCAGCRILASRFAQIGDFATDDVDIFSDEAAQRKIEYTAGRKNPAIVKANHWRGKHGRFPAEQSEDKCTEKSERVGIAQTFDTKVCFLDKIPQCLFGVTAVVTYLVVQARPETLEGRH